MYGTIFKVIVAVWLAVLLRICPHLGDDTGFAVVGTVNDASTGLPLPFVLIETSTGLSTNSGSDARYAIFFPDPGTYTVTYSKTGYEPESIVVELSEEVGGVNPDISLQPVEPQRGKVNPVPSRSQDDAWGTQ
jgi:hypothetical protein